MAEKSKKVENLELIQARQRECELIEGTGIWKELEEINDSDLSVAVNDFAIGELPEGGIERLYAHFMNLRLVCAAAIKLRSMFRIIKDRNVQELNMLLESSRNMAPETEDVDLDAGQRTLY